MKLFDKFLLILIVLSLFINTTRPKMCLFYQYLLEIYIIQYTYEKRNS